MNELTEKEKNFLGMLFKIANIIIEESEGYFEMPNFNYESFSRTDLFNLACTLGVENKY